MKTFVVGWLALIACVAPFVLTGIAFGVMAAAGLAIGLAILFALSVAAYAFGQMLTWNPDDSDDF